MTRTRAVSLSVLLLTCLTVVQGTLSELYFSNNEDIVRFLNGSSTVVIHELNLVDRIDCNVCDRLIYWVDHPGIIARADPTDSSTKEIVISSDFEEPRGLAVDWIGNNLYFSHGDGSEGKVEVSTCDGRYRRVLITGINEIGPIAVNVDTGYMYYAVEGYNIWRAMLNGSNPEFIYEDDGIDGQYNGPIVGLEVDVSTNKLYWTNNIFNGPPYAIKELDLNEEPLVAHALGTTSIPHELTIHAGTLYWTELQTVEEGTLRVLKPGALYSMTVGLPEEYELLRNETLSPQDLCYFFNSSMPSSGCSDNNGGCGYLCLTVPTSDGGIQPQCTCPTGIVPTADGACPRYPNQFLLVTQEHYPTGQDAIQTDIRIISLDTAPPFIDTLTPVTIPMASARFIAYDITQHHVYWSQWDPPQIRRSELDGTEEQIIIQTSISQPESLAVDPYSKNLYWVDSKLDKIEVVSLETYHRKLLIKTGAQPQGLALDLRNRWVYWTDIVAFDPSVERCHLDGSSCMEVPLDIETRQRIRQPATITVDPLTDYVYWAETVHDHIVVYNGRTGHYNEEELFVNNGIHPNDIFGLAVHGDYLYWTDHSGEGRVTMGRVRKSDLGGDEEVSTIRGVHGILAANTSAQSVISECSTCEQLCLPNESGATCACADHLEVTGHGGCTSPEALMFVSTDQGVYTATYGNPIWSLTVDPIIPIDVSRMDVHFETSTLYWIDSQHKFIYSGPISALYTEQVRVVHCCTGSIEDLAVDWYGQNLYWTDSSRRVIEVSKLDGTQRTVLYTIPSYLDPPELITLDPLRGQLYWSSLSAARIYRWNMNGSSVMEPSSVVWDSNQYQRVFGMALNYTEHPGVDDQLYFGANDLGANGVVFSLDITTEELSHIQMINPGRQMASFDGEFLYLQGDSPENFNIRNINPADIQNNNPALSLMALQYINPDVTSVIDFTILHHSIQPGLHECSVANNGCGSGAVCLVSSGVSGQCVCSPQDEVIQDKTFNCHPTNAFVLIATEDSIYHLPFSDPTSDSHTSLVQPLPLAAAGSIGTMAYDPHTRSVLYTNNDTMLHSVALDSSSGTTYPLPSGLHPTSLAFDWQGGHVFITETPGFQIELAIINGDGVGSVLSFEPNKYYDRLNLLGEVVFDSNTGTLYWTYIFTEGLGNELRYMSLLEQQEKTINLGGRNIRGLTIEPATKNLFWISVLDSGSSEIERYDLNAKRITKVHSGSDNGVEALASVVVSESKHYLLWFNSTEGAIFVHDGSTAQVYRRWSPGAARIVGMLGHNTTGLRITSCRDTDRPCSHYCVDTDTNSGYECACPANSQLTSPEGSQCNSVDCGSLVPCGESLDECYPRTYWCDGIPHCRNGADENCSCDPNTEFACYLSSDCVPMAARCDNLPHCLHGEDELDCLCGVSSYGCYVEDDTPDLLGGGSQLHYQCLDNRTYCDHMDDCYDSTIDEPDSCPGPITDNPSPATTFTIPAIIVCVVLGGGVAVVALILCVWVCKVLAKKKREDIASNRMSRALNFNLSEYKQRESPQQRVESASDYYSDCTNTTQIGCNSSHVSGNSGCKNRSGLYTDPSNPPPSPMSGRRSPEGSTDIEDDESVYSQPVSEYPIPPPPNPSLNYSMVSDNASYSVSQSQLHATISGRAPNPLLLQQQHRSYGYPYGYHQGVYQPPPPLPPSNGQQWAPKRETAYTNGKYTYTSDYHHYPPSHPRKELDSLARTETESTISMTTIDSTENRDEFDDVMSYANPGRCGRPTTPVSTVVSDYHPPAPPMSPDSTLSEFSGDECSTRQLNQT